MYLCKTSLNGIAEKMATGKNQNWKIHPGKNSTGKKPQNIYYA